MSKYLLQIVFVIDYITMLIVIATFTKTRMTHTIKNNNGIIFDKTISQYLGHKMTWLQNETKVQSQAQDTCNINPGISNQLLR